MEWYYWLIIILNLVFTGSLYFLIISMIKDMRDGEYYLNCCKNELNAIVSDLLDMNAKIVQLDSKLNKIRTRKHRRW